MCVYNSRAQAMAHNAPYERACDRRSVCVECRERRGARAFSTRSSRLGPMAALKAELDA